MRGDNHESQEKRESIDDAEDDLKADHHVDELGKEAFRDNGMFFDELGEVVEARCWMYGTKVSHLVPREPTLAIRGSLPVSLHPNTTSQFASNAFGCLRRHTYSQGEKTEAHNGAQIAYER